MPAQQIPTTPPTGTPESIGALPRPAENGAADGARAAFLALLGPETGSVATTPLAGNWRELAQQLFRTSDGVAVDGPTRQARPDRDDPEAKIDIEPEPAPRDRQAQSQPVSDQDDDGDGASDFPLPESDAETLLAFATTDPVQESKPDLATPGSATPELAAIPAALASMDTIGSPTGAAATFGVGTLPAAPVPLMLAGLEPPAQAGPAPTAARGPVPLGRPPLAMTTDAASVTHGDQATPRPIPGNPQVTVTREPEQLISRPTPILSSDGQATTLMAQSGNNRIGQGHDAPRHQPNVPLATLDPMPASGRTTPMPASGRTTAPGPTFANQGMAHQVAAGSATANFGAAAEPAGTIAAFGGAAPNGSVRAGSPNSTAAPVLGVPSGGTGQIARLATSGTTAARPFANGARPVIDQVAVSIRKAVHTGTDRITIQLKPATLGRIDVRLDLTADGRVQALITAERPETLELLQRDARFLERALQDAGLRADNHSLSFNLRGGHDSNAGAQSTAGSDHDPAADDGKDEGAVETAAATGGDTTVGHGLDIHV